MEERITNLQVEDFLRDFEENSTIEILEEGSKEKNEIFQIAKARGIDLKKNKDLAGFKCIYAFTDIPNKNGAILPEKPFLKALPSMIGKPINIGHQRKFVVGHILDYRYQLKEKRAIMYGTFYKSNFIDEWEQVKKDFKAKKLNVSFEIWSPKEKRKNLPNGTYELYDQEIAGCAVLFRDEEPAFDGARVLALAKKLETEQPELVYASKYKEDEIIICEKDNCTTIQCSGTPSAPIIEEKKESPTNITTSIICLNCKEQFEYNGMGDIICPKCFAILDRSGNMIYPPQLKDFKITCPSCSVNRWLIISKCDKGAKLRCLHCSKEYQVEFAKQKINELAKKMNFVYIGSARCFQCGKNNEVIGTSALKIKTVKCKYCGLEYSYDITKESYKKISKIEEIIKNKTSEQGGIQMAKEKKIEEKVEVIVEQKDESKVKEQPKVEGTPKAEEKPKAKETPKAEVAPKTEEKVEKAETPKKETPIKKEQPKVEAKEEKIPEKVEEKVEPEKADDSISGEKKDEKVEEKPVEKVEEKKEEKPVDKKDEKIGEKASEKTDEKPTEEKVEEAKETREQKYAKGIRKLASQVKELKKTLKTVKEDTEKTIAFYKANAEEINARRKELGDNAKDLTDKQILEDENYAKAKANMENADIETSAKVGDKDANDNEHYKQLHKKIDGMAFGREE